MEEYSEEKTVFDFENDDIILSVWIDKYADDPVYIEEHDVPDDEHIRRNGLACGRNYSFKDGRGWGCMFGHEYMLTSDVVTLKEGVSDFMSGKIKKFGPFPEKDPYGSDYPFFNLELVRDVEDRIHFSVKVDVSGSGIEYVDGVMSEEKLAELSDYYTRISEWFPVRDEMKSCKNL